MVGALRVGARRSVGGSVDDGGSDGVGVGVGGSVGDSDGGGGRVGGSVGGSVGDGVGVGGSVGDSDSVGGSDKDSDLDRNSDNVVVSSRACFRPLVLASLVRPLAERAGAMTTPEKALGDAIVSRLGDVKLDARAKTAAREFQSTHAKYDVADEAASNKELARRAALAAVGAADETLDGAVSRLADKLIGAGITKRNKAFGGFSDYAVSSLCNLGYAKEIVESAKLVRNVRKGKPPKDVVAACAAVERAAAAVKAKLAAYDAPQKGWQKAIVARDSQLLAWQKSLTRFRVLSRASLIDDDGAYEALFAAPESIAVAKTTRKKKVVAKPAPPVVE